MPKVSVIVPVFNAQMHIERSLTSLMEQTLDDIEIIILNDGSTDGTLDKINDILSNYPNRKDQTVIISRENRGVSATRAQGVDIAKGEFIIHFDSDDWADVRMLDSLYSKAISSSADMVICDFSLVESKGITQIDQDFSDSSQVGCIKALLTQKICNANWNKLVKSNLYKDNNINFISGLDMGEDFLVTFKLMSHAEKIVHLSEALYFYNKLNESALTNNYSEESLYSLIKVIDYAQRYASQNNFLSSINDAMDEFKLTTKALFIHNFQGKLKLIEESMELYPETNPKILSSNVSKRLKIGYLLHLMRLDFIIKFVFN